MAPSRPVWSSNKGKTCPVCGWPAKDCRCSSNLKRNVVGDGRVRVARETKGRKGKGVTLITGLPLDGVALKALAKELKRSCGTGGTVKDGVIEIQGEHRDALVADLKKRGYDAKRSGG